MAYTGIGTVDDVYTSNGTAIGPSFQPASGGAFFSITPYIVGTDANSQYATIQAAITQAISDGASDANPKNIYVKPNGSAYVETLTGAAGIRIIGLSIPTPNQQPIGTVFPRQGVVWTGTCTWASGCMSFQNIQTGYAGTGNIWTIPASGKLISQYCQFNNPGGGGVFVATSGNGANLEINSCIPMNVGTLINTTDTGLIVQMQNCAVANGGSINAVDGQWYFDNCKLDAFFIIGNSGAYNLIMNNCKAVDGFQFRADTNTQTTNTIQGNFCSFIESGTAIKTNKVSAFTMTSCGGAVSNLVDDSAGSGNTFNFYGCSFNSSNLVLLGAGSNQQFYSSTAGSNPSSAISNSQQVSTTGSDGFFYLPSCAGVPTGTPTTYGNGIPIVVNSGTGTVYEYSSGAWQVLGGNLVLIQSQTASSSPTLDFTTNLANYSKLYITFSGVTPVSNVVDFSMLQSIDGGATYEGSGDYAGGVNINAYNSILPTNTNSSAFFPLFIGQISVASITGFLYVDRAAAIQISGQLVSNNGLISFALPMGQGVSGVNALRFMYSSGDINGGTINVYGLLP